MFTSGTVVAASAAGALLMSTIAPAHADSVSFRDPRGDAPARYDLTTVAVANTLNRFIARVRVRDLRARGTQVLAVSISSPDYSESYALHTVRRPSGATTAELTSFAGEQATSSCAIRRTWRPKTDVIRVSVARGCIETRGALRVSVGIGSGDGSAGDPTDFTKSVRLGQS